MFERWMIDHDLDALMELSCAKGQLYCSEHSHKVNFLCRYYVLHLFYLLCVFRQILIDVRYVNIRLRASAAARKTEGVPRPVLSASICIQEEAIAPPCLSQLKRT